MRLILNKPGLSPPGDPQGENLMKFNKAKGTCVRTIPRISTELQFLKISNMIKVLSACAASGMNYLWEWPEHVSVITETLFLLLSVSFPMPHVVLQQEILKNSHI